MVFITMNLKKEWFNKIKNGQKTHEYRRANTYWKTRINNLMKKCALYDESAGIMFKLGYPKSDDEDKTLLAIIVKNPEIVNGIDTDLQIDAPVFDIEFKLLGE